MSRYRNSAAGIVDFTATPYHHIKIVSHQKPKRKSRRHIIAVKAITYSAALLAIYGLLYMEQSLIFGALLFGVCFTYLLLFAWANGGFK